jgi:alpha-beta hydrolase superfamily lysophospholipase
MRNSLSFRIPHSALRIFLVGISWGGKLAAALQWRHPGLVDGLALLCPGFCSKVRPPFGQRAQILWSRLVAPRRLFPVPLSDPALFTAAPRWQQFIRDDPLALRQATARLLVESVRLDGYLRFVPGAVRVPVLLLLAEHDRIIDNAATRRYVARFASPDKEIIEYSGAHHTLEFEPDPDRHLTDLLRWLERRAGAPRTTPLPPA